MARPFISLSNQRRKPARCWSTSLGDDPVTIVVTTCTVHSWRERLSTLAFPEVPEIVSPSTPTSPGFLGHRTGGSCPKRKGELATHKRPCRVLRGSAGGPTLDCATSECSSPRLANRYLAGFLQLFPKLRLLFGKVNHGTSSEYKRLPSVLTKRLLQVRVWRLSRDFARLMTQTQRFSSLLFFMGKAKSNKWRSLLDVLEQSEKQKHWNILQQHTLFNALPPPPIILFS